VDIDFSSAAALKAYSSLPKMTGRDAREMAQSPAEAKEVLEEKGLWLDFIKEYQGNLDLFAEYHRKGCQVIGFYDELYPENLRSISSPPNLLYLEGNAALLNNKSIAVVGTRQPTAFGETFAKVISESLIEAGLVTVSGLALGVDGICHRVSVENGGQTIAILGSGVDCLTPTSHKLLAKRILEKGLIFSEYQLGTSTTSYQLVARDRLQSGLAQALVVCQSPISSGTMHTVRFAAEQGKPIYCPVPHSKNSQSEGIRILLEVPASQLKDRLPAFQKSSPRLQLGDEPLAKPITRDNLSQVINSL